MTPLHTYRTGETLGPGNLPTRDSKDLQGNPIRVGDIVSDADHEARGLVVAIAGDWLIYLVDEPDGMEGQVDWFMPGECDRVLIIGHVYDLMAEVARIEALADAKAAGRG